MSYSGAEVKAGIFLTACFLIFVGMLFAYGKLGRLWGKNDDKLQQSIDDLEAAQKSLKDLDHFIKEQKSKLVQNEKTIRELEAEKGKLDVVVQTNRETVEAILSSAEARDRRYVFWGWIASYVVGILSGITVNILWHHFWERWRGRREQAKGGA